MTVKVTTLDEEDSQDCYQTPTVEPARLLAPSRSIGLSFAAIPGETKITPAHIRAEWARKGELKKQLDNEVSDAFFDNLVTSVEHALDTPLTFKWISAVAIPGACGNKNADRYHK